MTYKITFRLNGVRCETKEFERGDDPEGMVSKISPTNATQVQLKKKQGGKWVSVSTDAHV